MRLRFAALVAAATYLAGMLAAGCGQNDQLAGRLGIVSGRGGTVGVWVMNADGSQPSQVVTGLQPAWSPQGTLAYMARTADGNLDLFALRGGVSERLTTDPANDAMPAWSPDGQRIAFASDPGGNQDIYILELQSGQIIRLSQDPTVDLAPKWSPDGKKIAFVSRRDGNHEVYVMNADGSEHTRLTFDDERDDNPAWSPDGAKIAFNSFRTGQAQIWVMNGDGSDQRQLTFGDDHSFGAVWSPDGQWIAFTRTLGDVEGSSTQGIFAVRVDGSKEVSVPHDPTYNDQVYAWLPAASGSRSP